MSHRRRAKNNNILAFFIVIILVIISLVIGALILYKNYNKKNIDKTTLCEDGTNYNKHIILLDLTDTYNFVQLEDIKQNIEDIIISLSKKEQLKIFFLTNNISKETRSAITICNPGTGDNESYFYKNPDLIKKRYNEKFYLPLSRTVSELDNNNVANLSPIIEMIQWINVKEFKNSPNNKLTIVSDMIQNGKDFSFFKNKINDNFFTKMYFNKYRTNMKNFKVNILLTRRAKYQNLQNQNYLNFWIKYFNKQNAEINRIIRIDG